MSSAATGFRRETTTDEAGRYSIADLPPGTYNVTFNTKGFKPLTQTDLNVSVNAVTPLDVQLQLGEVTQEVTVQASAAMLQTEKTDVHTQLSSTAVVNLPLNAYRNFQVLVNLVPGATYGGYNGGFQNAVADTPERALSYNINGTARNNNNTRVDGAQDVFVWLPHHMLYVPPAETVQEVNVTTGSFDAEQGLAGGAAVTVVTKSGTNQFHGVLFGYNENQHLRARQFFETAGVEPQKAKSILNNDGAAVGGPIKRDKLFFFGSWDGLYERDNRNNFFTVPTDDLRRGDFSKVTPALLGANGATIYNPATGNPDGTGRQAFLGNVIPNLDPIAVKILSFLPEPNLSGDPTLDGNGRNYFASATQRLNRNNFDGKIDWNRTERHLIWGKYSVMKSVFHGDPALGQAIGDCLCDGGLGDYKVLVQLATIGHTWTFSPNFLIDGNFGFTRMSQQGQTPDFGKNIGLDVLGIPGTNNPTDKRTSGWPYFAVTGFSNIGNSESWNPAFRNDWSFTSNHNATWIRGKHEIRFGLDFVHHHLNHWQPELGAGPRGEFDFGGGVTALNGGPAPNQFNAFAQFLLGLAGELGTNAGNAVGVGRSDQFIKATAKEWQFGFYVGDRWKITPKLTATLGLRYEYFPLMTRDGVVKFDRYDPNTNEVLLGGVGSNPTHLGVTTSKKLFAPRVGLAYQINDKTVVRSGFGITYDPLPLARPLRGFYPLTVGSNFFSANSFAPFTSLVQGMPAVCCPDISQGTLQLPGAALERSTYPGLLKRGYIESWNFSVERKLPADFVVSTAYVGTQTVHEFADIDINASPPGTGQAGQPLFQMFGRSASTLLWQGWLSANYHSLQVQVTRQFSNGLLIKGAYTWSKAINWTDDDGWAGLMWNDPTILRRNRALASYDTPHLFHLAYLYELPFGQGKKYVQSGVPAQIVGGWQVNGLFTSDTGFPFTVTAPGTSLNSVANSQTADQVKPVVTKLGGIGPGQPFYDPTAFAAVTDVRYGSVGRNTLRGPGRVNMDFSLFRHFKLSERFELQFRAESRNIFNTPHFTSFYSTGCFDSDASSGTFMEITCADNDSRQFRLGLRLSF